MQVGTEQTIQPAMGGHVAVGPEKKLYDGVLVHMTISGADVWLTGREAREAAMMLIEASEESEQ